MATTQQGSKNARSEAAKKAAATRAAKKLEQQGITDEQRRAEEAQARQNSIAQFSQSQLNTPAVHDNPDPEAAKQKAFQDAVQALANSMGVDPSTVLAAQPAKPARADRQQKNGVTRPASGTATGKIWDLADKLSADAEGQPVPIATLRAHADLRQTNENTLKTQYARWRNYHGIKGRVGQPVKSAEEGGPNFGRRSTDVERREAAA
jgi:hypothetical protein